MVAFDVSTGREVRTMGTAGVRWWKWMLGLVLVGLLLPSLADAAASPHSYRLGSNDVVRIQVYGEEDLTVESKVDGDGNINFPLVGMVAVAGKTTRSCRTI